MKKAIFTAAEYVAKNPGGTSLGLAGGAATAEYMRSRDRSESAEGGEFKLDHLEGHIGPDGVSVKLEGLSMKGPSSSSTTGKSDAAVAQVKSGSLDSSVGKTSVVAESSDIGGGGGGGAGLAPGTSVTDTVSSGIGDTASTASTVADVITTISSVT